jgi:hypothetical protein
VRRSRAGDATLSGGDHLVAVAVEIEERRRGDTAEGEAGDGGDDRRRSHQGARQTLRSRHVSFSSVPARAS